MENIVMKPIGYIKNDDQNRKDVSSILLNEEYCGGLKGLDAIDGALFLIF